jgi:hypothetical protein
VAPGPALSAPSALGLACTWINPDRALAPRPHGCPEPTSARVHPYRLNTNSPLLSGQAHNPSYTLMHIPSYTHTNEATILSEATLPCCVANGYSSTEMASRPVFE